MYEQSQDWSGVQYPLKGELQLLSYLSKRLNIVLNNTSRTAWPTKIGMPFSNFSHNLDPYINFQNSVNNS